MFSMLREELEGSSCLAYDYVAYDVRGEQINSRT
jgi:hypothetical protein